MMHEFTPCFRIARLSEAQADLYDRYDRFHLIWVSAGTGYCTIDLQRYELSRGTVIFIYPGQSYSVEEKLDGYIISFSASYINVREAGCMELLGKGPNTGQAIYTPEDQIGIHPTIETLIRLIHLEFLNEDSFKTELLRALLKVLLLRLSIYDSAFTNLAELDEDQLIYFKFFQLVAVHFTQLKKVSDYARMLDIKPNYLNYKIKALTGRPASTHIQQYLIMEAQRLATWENKSFKEIAYQLDFYDISHFSKFFRTNMGMTFSDFKRSVWIV
jgi:AraC-like DNA-binding protein